eukprot:scaffold76631_cov37-Cyclotella_meneghiniana.AAC.1
MSSDAKDGQHFDQQSAHYTSLFLHDEEMVVAFFLAMSYISLAWLHVLDSHFNRLGGVSHLLMQLLLVVVVVVVVVVSHEP